MTTLPLRIAALVAVHGFTWWGTIVVAAALVRVSLAPPPDVGALVGTAVAVSLLHVVLLAVATRTNRLRGWALVQVLGWTYALLAVADPVLWAATVAPETGSVIAAFAVGGVVGLAVVIPMIVWLLDAAGRGASRLQRRDLIPRLGLRDLLFRTAVVAAVVVPGLGMAISFVLPTELADSFWSMDRYPVLALRGLVWVVALIPMLQTLPRSNATVLGVAAALAIVPPSVLVVASFGIADAAMHVAIGTAPVALLAGIVTSVWFRPRSL